MRRSALVVIDFPFSKFDFSSTVSGLTLTPRRMISDFSLSFSFSLTRAHPILVVPKSRPRIFFISIVFSYFATKVQISFEKFGIYLENL